MYHPAELMCRDPDYTTSSSMTLLRSKCASALRVAGDQRYFFTERMKARFNAMYGDVLIVTGYEQNLD